MQIPYRAEIDGLRALAVIAVVIYHAQFATGNSQLLTGGYLGVDVFFVISGYLIASIIIAEQAEGQFTFVGFYERRVRRIIPALLTVFTATLIAAWFILLPEAMEDFTGSLVSSLAFGSNIWFWLTDNYFAQPSDTMPLLHTWSLSIEEQFYLLFPITLVAMWNFQRHKIITVYAVFGILSLACAHLVSLSHPNAAFFLLHTRAWELLAGVLLALVPPPRRTGGWPLYFTNGCLPPA